MKESNALNLILIKIITSIYGAVTSVIARVGSTFAKSRRQRWRMAIKWLSADGDQPIVGNVVPNEMGEADGLTVIDGRDINASSL